MSDIIPNVVVSMPSQQFTLARKFQAASNGKIYIGQIDKDPTIPENQIQVYLENEDGSTIPVAQPLIINQAGFPVYNGQIAKFVTVEGHSMAVYDSYGAQQFYYPNVLKYDPDRLRYELSQNHGSDLIGINNDTLTQYLAKRFIYLDDILPAKDGSFDCSVALNSAIKRCSGLGVTLIGNPKSIYRFDDTIDFTGSNGVYVDFNYATLQDNVQYIIPEAGKRGKHTILFYDGFNNKIKNVTYVCLPTRGNSDDLSIPTCLMWVGGQYLGAKLTSDIEIKNIRIQSSIKYGMIIAAAGELNGIDIKNIFVNGGEWKYGCNFEYGLRPSDPSVDQGMDNGRHPYNITVDNFSGQNLPECAGFLRLASCYNAKFTNCNTFNVKSEVHVYSGDRGISRFSQNVILENCKFKNDESTSYENYQCSVLSVNKDGSTGEILPSWTNYSHMITFRSCEFWNNRVRNSVGIRFYGNKGKVCFEQCIIRDSYYATSIGPSQNPDYTTLNGLKFSSCKFIDNNQDFRIVNSKGVTFEYCSFLRERDSNIPMGHILSGGKNTVINKCDFTNSANQQASLILIDSSEATGTIITDNEFTVPDILNVAIKSLSPLKGGGNTTNGRLVDRTSNDTFGIEGQTETMFINADVYQTPVLDVKKASHYIVTGRFELSSIFRGTNGDVVVLRGTTLAANLRIVHNLSGSEVHNRILLKDGASKTYLGNSFAVTLMQFDNGWFEM
ncbi:phage head-binding domain-containing protein [Providencia sp. CRE-3FA-0001]|uniref:Phage head-binding domain-containing protein n=1 Tax=Providencia huashanensis TaxID=3037798 RepID=A0AA42FJU3_9GAMM|nr:phage head-binding domain-containing protein [Providencia sp. CRE-3FA-0001]MDG4696421.1 phage head-binding domain-containing protein [Providencia sp. CRE-3FA-0001]